MFFSDRIKPSFLIIGGIKCGTSSLYRYLNDHPQVLPCQTKEPQFFSNRNPLRILTGLNTYAGLFPKKEFYGNIETDWLDLGNDGKMKASKIHKQKNKGEQYITGEASANSFFAANPRIVKTILPKAKLIMLVRNPTDRFHSHYKMFQRFAKEGRSGYEVIELNDFVNKEIDAYHQGKSTLILHKGIYSHYLPKWQKSFGKENLITIPTPDLESKGQSTMNKLCQFLSIKEYDFGESLKKRHNQAKGTSSLIPSKIREKLDTFYSPSLMKLKDKFGIDLE